MSINITFQILEMILLDKVTPGPGCSKLTMSLVNISLKFQTLISKSRQHFLLKKASLIFSTKNISVFDYKVVKHLTS